MKDTIVRVANLFGFRSRYWHKILFANKKESKKEDGTTYEIILLLNSWQASPNSHKVTGLKDFLPLNLDLQNLTLQSLK